jgi:hypothetical protein
MQIISLDALLDETRNRKPRAALAKAEVIIGVDIASQRQFTVFGTPSLDETVRMGEVQALDTVRIDLDAKAGELEKLAALVHEIKGQHGSTELGA